MPEEIEGMGTGPVVAAKDLTRVFVGIPDLTPETYQLHKERLDHEAARLAFDRETASQNLRVHATGFATQNREYGKDHNIETLLEAAREIEKYLIGN